MKFLMFVLRYKRCVLSQGRKEVRWLPGQEESLAPPCSNLRAFASEAKLLFEESTCDIVGTFRRPLMIRRPGNCAPLVTPLFLVDNKNDGQVTSAFPSLSEQI